MRSFVVKAAAAGGYASVSEYVRELIRLERVKCVERMQTSISPTEASADPTPVDEINDDADENITRDYYLRHKAEWFGEDPKLYERRKLREDAAKLLVERYPHWLRKHEENERRRLQFAEEARLVREKKLAEQRARRREYDEYRARMGLRRKR
jgi:Arc/MetJ-type ribon-helix-helix transcriptional regulator